MFTFDCTTSDIVVVTTRTIDMFTLDVTTSDIVEAKGLIYSYVHLRPYDE